MRGILVTLIVLIFLPRVLGHPHIGVLLWSWIGYMNPHRLTWGFAYDFQFAFVIAIVTFIGILFSRERLRIPLTSVTVLLITLNIWFFVTTFFAIYPDTAWNQWEKVAKIQLMVFVTLLLIQGRERIHILIWVIAISLAFFGVKGGIFTIFTGGQYMVIGPPGTFIEGNTEIALAMIMVLPLLRYLQLNSQHKLVRQALMAAMILTGLAIIGSYSRGAFLAGAAMAGLLWIKSRQKFWLAVIFLISLPLMLGMMPDKWFEKMGTIQTYEEDASAMGRINAWWFAFHLANDHPLTGGGFDAFDRRLFPLYAPDPYDFHDAHSIYFEILGEQGYMGLTLFLMIGFMTWRVGSRIIRDTRGREDLKWAYDLASMIQVSLIGYAVGGAFLGLAYFDLFYHLVAIIVLTQLAVIAQLDTVKVRKDPVTGKENIADKT